ncbi:MAG TPA: roadblock/LC7 domain-containing protein [Thermoanaerobaculia bacterium]|nr:roadblock/LC7 domain-containing protein [Thermoanaerobaculia bacterium]
MTFEAILNELVNRVEGALGAMFLDWEGEAVQIVGRSASAYDLQLAGAYQGIYLDRLRKIGTSCDLGQPQSFRIRLEGSTFLNAVLKDGYYLVLVLRTGAPEGVAWERLRRTRERLIREI